MTFHDDKPLEPLVNERWEDFNVKVNVTLPQVLGWVDRHPPPLMSYYLLGVYRIRRR